MGTILGKEGSVKFANGLIAEVRTFKISEQQASIAEDSMSNPDWERSKGGRKSWTADVDIFYDPADTTGQGTVGVGDEGVWEFFPEGDTTGTKKRSGTARVESSDLDQSHDGLVEASLKLKGVGALSAWTTVV